MGGGPAWSLAAPAFAFKRFCQRRTERRVGHDHDQTVLPGERGQPPAGFPRPLELGLGDVAAGMNEHAHAICESPSHERQTERPEPRRRQLEFAEEIGDHDGRSRRQQARRFDRATGVARHDHPRIRGHRLQRNGRLLVRNDPRGVIAFPPPPNTGVIEPAGLDVGGTPMPHQDDSVGWGCHEREMVAAA